MMRTYNENIKQQIRKLRENGYTYTEIQQRLGIDIPKGSLTYICKGVVITDTGTTRLNLIKAEALSKNRQKAIASNKRIFESRILSYRDKNRMLIPELRSHKTQLIALAMLYLGEGAKWKRSRGLKLASSDPEIIKLYIKLLQLCYDVPTSLMRSRIQHRADQDPDRLLQYWIGVTGIASERFHKSYIDKRSIGKATTRAEYYGVCTIMCPSTRIQLELEEITGIIGEVIRGIGTVG